MHGFRHHSGAWLVVAIVVAAIAATPATAAASTVRIYSVAGAGFFLRPMISIPPPTGDGGPAGLALLTYPTAVAATPDGGFLVAETERQRIRRVSPRGIITTVAGTGRGGFSGDGGPATRRGWTSRPGSRACRTARSPSPTSATTASGSSTRPG